MKTIALILISVSALALGAGWSAGLLTSRLAAAPTDTETSAHGAADRTPLVEELDLTPEQRDQMREIWEAARGRVRDAYEDAQRLQQRRDDAIVKLLNDEQKAQFERISKEYADRFSELNRSRDSAFADAVERTKKLLNETQRQKYEQILKAHVGPDKLPHDPGAGPMAPGVPAQPSAR